MLYTDGVIEARRERELFGEERLAAAGATPAVGPRGLDADAIADAIREATVAFAGSTEDDTTMPRPAPHGLTSLLKGSIFRVR